jgi:hypothetical protein
MSLSYYPMHLADMSIYAIVVHRLLAQLVLQVPCPAAELVPGLWILNQPID